MKRINKGLLLSVIASTMIMAGGDVAPVSAPVEVVEVETKDFYVGVSTVVGVTDPDNINWFGYTTAGVQAGWTGFRAGNFETSIEARYATDTANWFDTYSYGAYVKPGYDLGGVTAYGLVGYQDGDSNDFADFEGELAYGGGVLTDVLGLEVFADYLYGDKTKSEVVTVGVNYRF